MEYGTGKDGFGCIKFHAIPELLLQTEYVPFTRRKRPGSLPVCLAQGW